MAPYILAVVLVRKSECAHTANPEPMRARCLADERAAGLASRGTMRNIYNSARFQILTKRATKLFSIIISPHPLSVLEPQP